MATVFTCTAADLQTIQDIVGSTATANTVCSLYDVSTMGAEHAALKYLYSQVSLPGATPATPASDPLLEGFNTMTLLFSGYLVFMMQAGFALLCAGAVRQKSCLNILLKNTLDACVGTLAWYLLGYALAFGAKDGNAGGFIGNWDFALSQTTTDTRQGYIAASGWHFWFFQWAFSAAAATIVSGAMAERCAFGAYLAYSFVVSAFVYPVVVHWVWSPYGWLCAFNVANRALGIGAIDYAGSGVVHMVGGWCALAGAAILGPRIGRFDTKASQFAGHNVTLQVLGTFLLWFGWYGFNPGSQLVFDGVNAQISARVAVTTTIAAGAGGVSAVIVSKLALKNYNVPFVCNGILCGLVAITAGCSVVEPWAAVIAGMFAPAVFLGCDMLLIKLKVDDPVSAWPMHGCCGAFGVIFVGFLAREDYVLQVYPGLLKGDRWMGVFYGGNGKILACQIIEVLVIIAWAGGLMAIFFFCLKKLKLLRVSLEEEMAGLDVTKHGGKAYPEVLDEPSTRPGSNGNFGKNGQVHPVAHAQSSSGMPGIA